MGKRFGFMRGAFVSSWHGSPFQGLERHAEMVKRTIKPLRNALIAYINGEYEKFESLAKVVIKNEHTADEIKDEIRAELPPSVFMPVDKSFFLMLLKEEDSILDYAEDVVIWVGMRKTTVPEELKKDFLIYFDIVDNTIEAYSQLTSDLKNLVESGFAEKERENILKKIHRVHELEYEADKKERDLTKKLFDLEGKIGPLAIYHLIKTLNIADQIANHAENAAEMIRAMATT